METNDQNTFTLSGLVIGPPALHKTAKGHDVTQIKLLTERLVSALGERKQRIMEIGVWGDYTASVHNGYRIKITGELYPGKYGPMVTGTNLTITDTDRDGQNYARMNPTNRFRPWEKRR